MWLGSVICCPAWARAWPRGSESASLCPGPREGEATSHRITPTAIRPKLGGRLTAVRPRPPLPLRRGNRASGRPFLRGRWRCWPLPLWVLVRASVGPLGLDPGLFGRLLWACRFRLAYQRWGLGRSVLLCHPLCRWEAQGTGQLLEESRALTGRECLEQAVEEVLLVLGLPRCRCRVLGWLGVARGSCSVPGCWPPRLVEALSYLQLLLVLH